LRKRHHIRDEIPKNITTTVVVISYNFLQGKKKKHIVLLMPVLTYRIEETKQKAH
jgi:hypothetical protein